MSDLRLKMGDHREPELITSLDEVTPAWLTRVLQRTGLLNEARVAEVSYDSGETSFSIIAHLRISYTCDCSAPTRLFLKFSKPNHPVSTPECGWEVLFYRFVAPRTPTPLLHCYVSERIALFTNFLGDRLSAKRRDIYREVLAGLPVLYTRLMLPRAYTVIHDDIHIGNVLYPRDATIDGVRIIDWQTWHIDLAPKDLAHMMVIFWFPEQRKNLERLLLRHYYDRLCEDGVGDYSWDELWNDYRLCVIRKLFHPAWQWETGHHPNIWWNHLERVMTAYEDLHCRELIKRG